MFRNRSDFSLPKQKVVIAIRGGAVQVESAPEGVEVEIIDYDNQGVRPRKKTFTLFCPYEEDKKCCLDRKLEI
ncbi:hypothetical protein [Bacillus taeanensis]|uniref:Uncharacterized protein n=1 Tax=Bacillus taeanensis TaxID=273032 RepID=A0A366XN27_9BACI|nr:hypothetical protein [Bacillus taeanensis]RBW67307.1 hypothetical protein DS031_22845 [Bacillus taeanensis]